MAQRISTQHAEDLLMRMHVGAVVDPDVITDGTRGAIPVHPTGLVITETAVLPVEHTIAPGIPLPPGVHENHWVATTRKHGETVVAAQGTNYIVVGNLPAPDPRASKADGTPLATVPTEFRNYAYQVQSAAALRRDAQMMQKQGREARSRLIADLDVLVRSTASTLDVHDRVGHGHDDVSQIAREIAIKAVDDYIDPAKARPHVAITGFIYKRLQRDVPRAVRRNESLSDEKMRLSAWANAQEDADSLTPHELAVRYHADKVRAARAKSFSGTTAGAATDAQIASTERTMKLVDEVRRFIKPAASLDSEISHGDGSTYLRDSISDPVAQEAFEEVESGNLLDDILSKWFAGAGVDTARLHDLVAIMQQTGGNPSIADLNSSADSDYIRWALEPLRKTTESWESQGDVSRIMARFGGMIVRDGRTKSDVDIANCWDAFMTHSEYAARTSVPNYFSSLAF